MDAPYLSILNDLLERGTHKSERTGTRSLFGVSSQHDLDTGFLLLTMKKLRVHSILHELLWLLNRSFVFAQRFQQINSGNSRSPHAENSGSH